MIPCPKCSAETSAPTPLFPASTYWCPEGLWCPRCKGLYQAERGFTPTPPAPALVPDIARGVVHGLPYGMRVEPDGLVLFRMACGRGDWREWRATPEQLRRLGHAALSLAHAGEKRQEHLRGADRWVFRRGDGETFFAKLFDAEAELVPWCCGGRRPNRHGRTPRPESCSRCGVDLVKGARGYRAGDKRPSTSRVSWSEVRFCARCVESAPKAETRGILRVFDGGKATSTGTGASR